MQQNNEINYEEVFGVLPEGENEQEAAAPAPGTSLQGENEQEAAAPATEAQSPEENARYAAARRRAEKEKNEAVERAKTEAQATVDRMIRDLNLVNPYTNTAITNKAEYDNYMLQKQKEAQSKVQNTLGMSDEDFAAFKNSLPEVAEAREAMKKIKSEKAEFELQNQIQKISAFDESVQSVDDIISSPSFPQVLELVKKGYALEHAWKIINADSIFQGVEEKSRQAALNRYNAKSHMSPITSRGEGNISVPRDVREMYLAFNPDATDAEITKHYNQMKK